MEKTIEEIYLLNKNLIYNYFLGVALDPHIAEDLTQETFLKAFR